VVSHIFFNRSGGVSNGRFTSLNVSYDIGDDGSHIQENRNRIKERLGARRLISANQVHGSRVYAVGSEMKDGTEVDGFDALITDVPGTALLIQQADCQAVLLHDPVHKAIGAIHNGWRGSVANIIAETIARMSSRYDTAPEDLHAWIGPSLGPCCAEFVNFRVELPEEFQAFMAGEDYFNFWSISAHQLMQTGLKSASVKLPDICTSCSDDYFSYRRAVRKGDGITGRHGSAICLAPSST